MLQLEALSADYVYYTQLAILRRHIEMYIIDSVTADGLSRSGGKAFVATIDLVCLVEVW